MRYLEEKKSNISILIENQFPSFVQQNNPQFLKFLSSYYESLETKYQPLDIASNLIDYYNISYYKPNTLIKETKLTSILLANSTIIPAEDTTGFPIENGYIKIDDEIIFYKSITANSFVDCVRGTSALILENIPKSEVVLTKSNSEEHELGSAIKNIAYDYSSEFFKRIKSELAPLITENVVEELDFAQFLKNIKSFYSAKGSLNGHRIIFKILFNDKKYNILLKPRGSGAKLKINNYNKYIPKNPPPQIVNGGSNYDFRKDPNTNEFLNSPIIDILGSGTGAVNNNGLRPNKTAIVKVTGINTNGTITSVEVVDQGEEYIGPIRSKVRPRSFYQDQKVYNNTGTGYGKVEFWDGFKNELILYDVVGFFKSDDEIIGIDGESPRAFISRAFIGTTSIRSGVETIPEVQNIEFPREYTFRTSDSQHIEKKILKCKLMRGKDIITKGKLPQTLTLRQDKDILFGVEGTDLEVDNIISLRDNTYEFEVSANTNLSKLYLPPSTEITINSSYSGSNFIVTVDDASRFPVTNGILYVNGVLIEYAHRSIDQFFDCNYYFGTNLSVGIGDEVISWGRKKYTIKWNINETINQGEFRYYKDNLYKATSSGITSSINGPTHTSGVKRDGRYADGNPNPVKWQYIGKNTLKHTLYDIVTDTEFEFIAVPGNIVIVDGGSLHTQQQYEFANVDSPNQQMYNFTSKEISDRLGVVLSGNYNRGYNTVTDSRLPSFGSLSGFNSSHDFEDYIYVATSAIPRWWNEIVDLTQVTLNSEDLKKVSFTNQKLITRYRKSTLVNETRVGTDLYPTKKSIAVNADAIQVNSYKGNTINYGKINNFTIAKNGDYKVVFRKLPNSSFVFDFSKFPSFTIKSKGLSDSSVNGLVRISSNLHSINFNALAEKWKNTGYLTGFTTKPVIEIINNNPTKSAVISKTNLNFNTNTFTITYSSSSNLEFKTADKVTYFTPLSTTNPIIQLTNIIPTLVDQSEYYLFVVSTSSGVYPKTVTYSIHKTKSEAILGSNKIQLSVQNPLPDFNFSLLGESLNPIDFKSAELDLSYNEDTKQLDNIIIRDSGSGYVEAPTIRIVGGGKSSLPQDAIIIPYEIDGVEIIEMRGPLVSYTNYDKNNSYEIDSLISDNNSYEITPEIVVDAGSDAEAVAYVSNGKINSVIPTNGGKNYFTVPTVRLTGSGGSGTDAVVHAKINNGNITDFVIVNPGRDYIIPITVEIIPAGSGAVVTARLNEWTFNLVQRLETIGRIDSFGGYVYNKSDYKITSSSDLYNPSKFVHIIPDNDLAPGITNAQYLLLKSSKKLLAKYTLEQRSGLLSKIYPNVNFTYQTSQGITDLLNTTVHSPVIAVAYDGVPVYGNRGYSIRYDASSTVTEIPSRYKLKYSTINSTGSISIVVNGTTYYVNRPGGPLISQYPIGSFIEDYVFEAGDSHSLDKYNGRFCVTPEFPDGRYCYFTTTSSFDAVTNGIIQQSNVNFNGFPYFVGNGFASIPDTYTNNFCRTNDKIPKAFTRSVDVAIPRSDQLYFPGLPSNKRYPKEDVSNDKTISGSSSLTPGSVDSVIIEYPGKNYKVGDKLVVDNTLSFGSGFGGFVSKIHGKEISTFIIDNGKITVFTSQPSELSINDFVYFDYTTPSNPVVINFHDSNFLPISSKLIESQSISAQLSSTNYSNKRFYSLSLNKKFKYKFNIPNLPYSFTYDIDKLNEYFVIEENNNSDPAAIIFDASKLPTTLYLHIGNYIYEITTSIQFSSQYRVSSINVASKSFTCNIFEDVSTFETSNIKYITNSINPNGSIAEISVSNGGYNYRNLPSVTVDSKTGSGAIVQLDSTTIGKIRNIKYLTAGGGFTSNLNVNYYLNLPSTAKIINNFEIYEVEVIAGGNYYKDKLELLVDGKSNLAKFKINVQIGVITSIEILDGGSNFETVPELQLVSTTGVGAILKAKIRRKKLFSGEFLTAKENSILFPVKEIRAKTLSFNELNSTFEFEQNIGEFKNGDLLYTSDGKKYGRITKIRRSVAYAKVNPYINLESSKLDITGNTSESLQKITDNIVYQNWSYILSSSRDTKDWRDQITVNTHPAGHKLFGKKIIDRRKSFFDNPDDVFKTNVIFTANLINKILLKVKLTPCKDQVISIINPGNFSIGDYVFGSISESIGRIEEITEYSLKLSLLSDTRFKIGEFIIKVPASFSFGIESATSKSFVFWNGIMQQPEYSYESAFKYVNNLGQPLTVPVVDVLIPKFDLLPSDELLHYKVSSALTVYDSYTLDPNDDIYFPSLKKKSVSVSGNFLNQTIISVGGAVQNPSDFQVNVNEKYIKLNDKPNSTATVFAIGGENLHRLIFTGPTSGTKFQLNHIPTSNCQLLIFYSGIEQSHLLTDYSVSGNEVVFSTAVEKTNIFGWINIEPVECLQINVNDLLKNKITGTWNCDTKNFTESIHSSAVKTPSSLYEIRKEYLDGTIFPDPDNTTLYGFDTKFTYTTPEYSRSFVEVLDTIQFTGVDKSFKLTRIDGNSYTPVRGEGSLMVYVDNVVVDPDEYSVTGDTILFNLAYASSSKCTIIDFNSTYRADSIGLGGANLDRLNVQHNGIRKRFNLSDRGVPQYTKNVGDVFAIRNGILQRPDQRHQTISTNKITFNDAPEFIDTTDLVYFNRQLLPLPTKNVVLDDFYCFDGVRKDFPLTLDGINFYPINVYNLFVVRNGVYQKPGIDFRLGTPLDIREVPGLDSYELDGSHLVFDSAPEKTDEIIVFYSYDGLNQNLKLDPFRYFNGVQKTFSLTKNYISTTPTSSDHIQVYRNGVYQYSGLDYIVETTNGGPRITFTTAPLETDDIFVTEYNTSTRFVNKTIDFVQINSNTIKNQSNESLTTSDVILIYKSGILITDGWLIDYTNQVINFDESFTIDNKTRIFVVKNCEGQLDKFFKFDGVETTFPITKNVVSKTPHSENHIQVYRNGVYQYSGVDYSVFSTNGGPRITFTSAPLASDNIFITNFHSTSHFTDATSGFTQISSTKFQYTSSIGAVFLLIFKDGIIQLEDSYTVSNNTITFSEPVVSPNIRIYFIGNQVKKLDNFYIMNGVNKVFPLSYFSESITTDNILVYRNGVYQYPILDYNVSFNTYGNKLISFITAPNETENIFIVEATNTTNFEDITNNFVQDNSTTLGNITTLNQSKILLVYNQGILQNSNSYSYNYITNKLQFTETFALNSSVRIYAVKKIVSSPTTVPTGILDNVYKVDGTTTTFPLTINNSSFTVSAEQGIGWPKAQVIRNGVFQTQGYYTTNTNGGPRIIFDDAPIQSEDIFVTAFAANQFVELISNPTTGLTETSSTVITYNGTRNLSAGVVLIFREGILQKRGTYTQIGNVFTFSESITLANTKFYHLENTTVIDSPYFKNGVTNTFPLTKNNQSISSSTVNETLVYRNGVYQYYGVDYVITAANGGPRITFTTSPQSTEPVFIHNFTNQTGFKNLTPQFTVITPTTYQYSGIITSEPLLVFVGGIMQVRDSWSFNLSTKTITFTEIPNGTVNIFQIQNCPILVNQIVTSAKQTRYQLKNGRKNHFPASAESLFVCVDGIVQQPNVSYAVVGSELVFINDILTTGVPLIVIDASAAGLRCLDDIETAWEIGDKKYLRTLQNYQSVNDSQILLTINGIVQDPNFYSVNNYVMTIFDQPENPWSVIEIFNATQSGFVRLDNLGSMRSITNKYKEMVMFDNYWTISSSATSLVVNADGVVQNPKISYETNGTLIRFNSPTINLDNVEVINVTSGSLRILDKLSDLSNEYVDSQGLIHTEFVIRNSYTELTTSTGALVVYGSIVQKPGVDYVIHNNPLKTFKIITEYGVDLSQLKIYDVSKTSYELIDNLDSLIYSSGDNYTLRITNKYQTISGLYAENTLVQINGIVQNVSSYNIINSTITLIGLNYKTAKVYNLSGANLRLIDNLSEDFSTPTFKLTQNYSTFTPSNLVDIFLLRDSVLQNPTEDYIAGSGYITFTSNIQKSTDIFILYTHNSQEIIPILAIPYTICTTEDTYTLPYAIPESDKTKLILYLNGVPNFYGKDFLINGTTLSFLGGAFIDENTVAFIIKYTNITYIDNLKNCPDGIETKFKLLYKGKNVLAQSSADILTSRNGIVQKPNVDYTVSIVTIGGNSIAKYVTFVTPLDKIHNTFFVRMYQNISATLTQISATQYQVTSPVLDFNNLYVFANGNWMLPTKDYTLSASIITLQVPAVDVFAIEFTGVVKLLDEIHTPYDSIRNRFNLFLTEENFVPLGTIEYNTIADETSILVVKNGKVLDPKIDYILSGDIRSQIVFQTAPIFSDIIMIKSVGSFKKLNTITSGFTGTVKKYDLKTLPGSSSLYNGIMQRNGILITSLSNEVKTRNNGIIQLANNPFQTQQVPSEDYYPNAEIERPRDHENQILIIKDGYIQSPVYDYYIDNNKLVFNNPVTNTTSKIVIMDFRGTVEDVHVDNRLYQLNVGDKVSLDCAIDEERTFTINRTVTKIISPTVLKTTTETQNIFANFSASVVYNGGKVTDFVVSGGGTGYSYPSILRTKGSGYGAKGVAQIDIYGGGRIKNGYIDIQYPGYNIYVPQEVFPTVYAFTYRNTQLTSSNFTKATALTANISDTADVIPVIKTSIFKTNPLQIQITSPTGSGASFIPFVINGYLRKLQIVNGGIGYDERYIQVNVIGGGGSGAVLEPVLDALGRITNMIIRNPGIGYDSFRAFINSEAIEYTTKTNTELLGVTRNVLNYGLNPNEFPLVKNELFITVHSEHNLQVFRNGVHQIPGIDFYTVPIHSGCDKIYFTTPVELGSADNVFITHFDTPSNFTNISSSFTQVNSTTIQYNGTLSYQYLLMFIDGVVQLQDAWSFNSNTNRIIFDQPVDISSQSVLIYRISSPVNVLNTFAMTLSNTYTLSSSVSSAESIMVIIDGVVQQPYVSYTTSGSTINFANVTPGSDVHIINFASANYRLLDDIKVSRWINTSTCAIGHKQTDRVYSGTYL